MESASAPTAVAAAPTICAVLARRPIRRATPAPAKRIRTGSPIKESAAKTCSGLANTGAAFPPPEPAGARRCGAHRKPSASGPTAAECSTGARSSAAASATPAATGMIRHGHAARSTAESATSTLRGRAHASWMTSTSPIARNGIPGLPLLSAVSAQRATCSAGKNGPADASTAVNVDAGMAKRANASSQFADKAESTLHQESHAKQETTDGYANATADVARLCREANAKQSTASPAS